MIVEVSKSVAILTNSATIKLLKSKVRRGDSENIWVFIHSETIAFNEAAVSDEVIANLGQVQLPEVLMNK